MSARRAKRTRPFMLWEELPKDLRRAAIIGIPIDMGALSPGDEDDMVDECESLAAAATFLRRVEDRGILRVVYLMERGDQYDVIW